MEVKDVFIAPFFLLLLFALVNGLRGKMTDAYDRKYFMPAFWAKIGGGFAFQIIHSAFYPGGDTFNYYRHEHWLVKAFWNSPADGIALFTRSSSQSYEVLKTIDLMWWYNAPSEYLVVQVASAIGLVSLDCYTCLTFGFGFISFLGCWSMFRTMCRIMPNLTPKIAVAALFVPSVVFWGSGLLKDPLCLSAMGFLFTAFYDGLIARKRMVRAIILGLISAWVLFTIKRYILFCFLPPAMIWVFMANGHRIKNRLARTLLLPLFTVLGGVLSVVATTKMTENDSHYSLDNVGERTKITADYIHRMSEKDGGSSYSLGELDGSLASMIVLAPQAINVSLFRPYPWEIKSPIMMLSMMESMYFLFFTLRLFARNGVVRTIRLLTGNPLGMFCIIFTLLFSFAVGITSNNFGTLARYKIPMMPFYLLCIYIIQYEAEQARLSALRRFAMA